MMRRLRITALSLALTLCQPGCATPDRVESAPRQLQATSLLGQPLYSIPPDANLAQLQADLDLARWRLVQSPDDPARIVWVGRRLGYLWQINDAVEVYSDGIAKHPDYAPLYRHRGHRYITLRQFDQAIADLERAAELIQDAPERIEPDGMPNARNIPLTTTAFNVWYHLALARYLQGDYTGALTAYRETAKHTRGLDDNLVAVTDWMYMTHRRLGHHRQARMSLLDIKQDMDIIENDAYHRRCLMYKGLIDPADLLDMDQASQLDVATLGYGLGVWYLCNGDTETAIKHFEQVTAGPYWPAFGFIAAEAELARLHDQ